MQLQDDHLLLLARAVADGAAVDWAQAESTAGAEERLVVQQLHVLARMGAAAHAATTTWGPLHVRAEIANGTFGTVYRAWDPRLEREVALKLLHEDPLAATFSSAVVNEGRLLAQIRHPNIVTVYGADECDGRVGIWMELVTGRTLREIVTEHGPLGAPEAALIGRDLCRALAAVHGRGFLHRDVKAQNVMREAGGRTVLMEFGAGEPVPHGSEGFTLRGTPAYLAPEVLAGQPPGVKSDIYSLGVLLYFLVSGDFPVTGSSIDDFRERHARGKRSLLRDVRPDLPREFVRIVDACTATNADARPATAGAVEALLEGALGLREDSAEGEVRPARAFAGRWNRLWAIGLLPVITALAVAGWALRDSPSKVPSSVSRRDSVAILPFNNLTASPEDEYFSEGITADLIANLSALRDLRVIAGASTRKYRKRDATPSQIGAELGVATVLDATVRRSGDRVRIVTQLIDTRTGEQIWSGSFEGNVTEIITMKSDVSNQIAVAMKGELSQRDMELLRPGRKYDYDAFNLYLKGRHYWGLRNEEALNRSIQYFHDALARDPQFAPAYAGLSDAYTTLGVYGSIPREEAYARAAAAAAKAVQLDDSLAEAHASLGLAQKNRFEWTEAERSFKRALELKPGSATAHQWYSVLLTQLGRFAEATAEIKLAIYLDPLSVAPKLQFASMLTMSRRYDDAIAQYEQALRMDGGFATAYRHIAGAYVHKRDYARALALFDEARRKSPVGSQDHELKADLGYLFAMWGRKEKALAIAHDLVRRYETAHEEVAGSIAAIYAGLGRRGEAITWLTRAHHAHDPEIGYLLVDPRWDNLREEARFANLLRTLGFMR